MPSTAQGQGNSSKQNKSTCFLVATVLRASGEYKGRKWMLKTFIFIQKQYHN